MKTTALVVGQDASGNIKPLLLDANGNVLISVSANPLPVYSKVLDTVTVITSMVTAAGLNSLIGLTVSSGKIFVCEFIGINFIGNVAGISLYTQINVPGIGQLTIDQITVPANSQWYNQSVNIHIPSGYDIRAVVTGAPAGASMYLNITGYEIPVV